MDFEPSLVLEAALPSIQSRLQSPDVWVRESALLALGALANGCRDEMSSHLNDLFPFLLAMVMDAVPEVFSPHLSISFCASSHVFYVCVAEVNRLLGVEQILFLAVRCL